MNLYSPWGSESAHFSNKWKADLHEQSTGRFAQFDIGIQLYERELKSISKKQIDLNYDYDLDFLKDLRKNHRYIRLHYSGGADSHNIFQKCLDNNIFIDEINMLCHGIYTKDTVMDMTDIRDAVIKNCAYPFSIKHKDGVGKIEVISHTVDDVYNGFYDLYKKYKSQWIYELSDNDISLVYHLKGKKFIHQNFVNDSFCDCQITGKEKPNLVYYNGSWYATVLDNTLNEYLQYHDITFFYVSPFNLKSYLQSCYLYRGYIYNAKEFDKSKNLQFFTGNKYEYRSQDNDLNMILNKILRRANIELPHIASNHWAGKIKNHNQIHPKLKHEIETLINFNMIELVADFFSSITELKKYHPDLICKDNQFSNRLPAKFAWFIDIDTMQIYSQKELIPNGFQPKS
jgi:hypothetical protein